MKITVEEFREMEKCCSKISVACNDCPWMKVCDTVLREGCPTRMELTDEEVKELLGENLDE